MKKMCLALCFLLIFPNGVLAWQTGNEFLRLVEESDKSLGIGQAFGMGYVSGVADGMRTSYTLGLTSDKSMMFDIPEGVDREQMLGITMKYLKEHPEGRHLQASFLIWHAFITAFPGKNGQKTE